MEIRASATAPTATAITLPAPTRPFSERALAFSPAFRPQNKGTCVRDFGVGVPAAFSPNKRAGAARLSGATACILKVMVAPILPNSPTRKRRGGKAAASFRSPSIGTAAAGTRNFKSVTATILSAAPTAVTAAVIGRATRSLVAAPFGATVGTSAAAAAPSSTLVIAASGFGQTRLFRPSGTEGSS